MKSGDTLPPIDGAAVDKEIVWIRHDVSPVYDLGYEGAGYPRINRKAVAFAAARCIGFKLRLAIHGAEADRARDEDAEFRYLFAAEDGRSSLPWVAEHVGRHRRQGKEG